MTPKDMDYAMFDESTHHYWSLLSRYPDKPLDAKDTRKISVQINLFALCVMHMAESGWSKEVVEQKFQDCWASGVDNGYTRLINLKLKNQELE